MKFLDSASDIAQVLVSGGFGAVALRVWELYSEKKDKRKAEQKAVSEAETIDNAKIRTELWTKLERYESQLETQRAKYEELLESQRKALAEAQKINTELRALLESHEAELEQLRAHAESQRAEIVALNRAIVRGVTDTGSHKAVE